MCPISLGEMSKILSSYIFIPFFFSLGESVLSNVKQYMFNYLF